MKNIYFDISYTNVLEKKRMITCTILKKKKNNLKSIFLTNYMIIKKHSRTKQ
jgi:hypothetical protein